MDIMFDEVKFLTLENEQTKPFTVMFGGVFSHRSISKMFPDLSVISAGSISIDNAGIVEPYGYSNSLRVYANTNTPSLSSTFYKGVLLEYGCKAFFTDNLGALQKHIAEGIKGTFNLTVGANKVHQMEVGTSLNNADLKQVRQSLNMSNLLNQILA